MEGGVQEGKEEHREEGRKLEVESFITINIQLKTSGCIQEEFYLLTHKNNKARHMSIINCSESINYGHRATILITMSTSH